jgi:hypothetical protein
MQKSRMRLISLTSSLVLVIAIMWSSSVLIGEEMQNPPQDVEISIKKVKKKWKVVDATDSTNTNIKGKRGQKIVWKAEGSDVYFQFMDDKLVGNYTRRLKDGQKLTLVIGPNAKKGVNYYAVFCLSDSTYAVGGSPPKLTIE